MKIMELKEHIMKNELKHLYVFIGDEIGIMNIYLEKMSNTLHLPIVRSDSVLSIYSKCTTRSFFGDEDCLYVIRNDTDIQKHEEMYTRLESEIGKNVIILLYDKIDSRLKFGKYFKDSTVEFEPLTTSILVSYIKKTCALNSENAEKLSNIVRNSYDQSMLECDKIEQYASREKIDVNKAFLKLLDSGVIVQPEEEDIFKFADYVLSRDMKSAFNMLNVLIDNGNSSANILGVLYQKIKNVLLIQVCESSDICEVTGLSKGEVYYNKPYVNKYPSPTLVRTLKLIAKTVDDIKSGGIDDNIATHYVLLHMV